MFTKLYIVISEYLEERPETVGLLGFIVMCLAGLLFALFVFH